MLMLMIGYSTYAVIVIRSSANPPMDQNSPEDIFTLGNYLSRDQYGYRPLMYGQTFSSEYKIDQDGRVQMDEGQPIYQRKEKKTADEPDTYFVVSTKDKPKYAQNMLFPRMYSNDSRHISQYKSWVGGFKGTQEPSNYRQGSYVTVPTQWENIKFFFAYQCNWMYWRYFLWNFAGRQNDIQGNGELEHGNWLSGIPFIDNARLGNQSLLPDDLKNNKGHNVFYCLPLLLGLLGIFWQGMMRGQKGVKQFWVVFFLFFMTGLAIVVYLNQTPLQPRERDYASHRRTKTGKAHMFSGLVYCADCKAKMRYCTTQYYEPRQDHYVCANYRSNTGSCSIHFIRAVVLEKMVWEHLKEVIWYVGHYEGHFRSIMEARLQAESKEALRVKRKQLEKDEKRIQELDHLFIRLYEDNVASRISDDRFTMMSQAYENEQRDLKADVEVLRQEIETQEQQNQNLELFIQKIRKYAELTELTPYAAHELIKAIYIGAPDKSSGKRRQSIHICYDLIGFIPLSELMTQEMA